MTVQELINLLEKVEDKTQDVKIAIYQYNKVYPIAYMNPWNQIYLQQIYPEVRINVSLPYGVYTVKGKEYESGTNWE